MASLGLAPDELKQLDMVRNRFVQVAKSLNSLHTNIYRSDPLPSREGLQNSARILLSNINSIQDVTDDNAELFQRIAVHPSTNFPGRTHEHILLHLLRKKLEPDVESWAEEARETARAAGLDASKLTGGAVGSYGEDDAGDYGLDQEGDVPSDPFNEQWADMRDACFEAIKDYALNQSREPYTVEEQAMGIKNVRTGLKRSLDDDSDEYEEDDEDEDEDEDMGGGAKGSAAGAIPGQGAASVAPGTSRLQPEHVLWFSARGDLNLPPNIEFESQKVKPARKPGPGMPGPSIPR